MKIMKKKANKKRISHTEQQIKKKDNTTKYLKKRLKIKQMKRKSDKMMMRYFG